MSTATKLEYLNNTKGLLKDNINLTGAGLTNQTPFRQYATDLKTALLNILNNGIDTLYNNFPKTTGTGTNITLNNTLQAPIRSVINGDTEQDGEPTPDNPKEIKSVTGLQKIKVQGKNYIDMSKVTARTDVSINSISNEVINFRITNPNPSLLITNKIPKGTYKVRKSSAIKGLVRFNNANNTQVSSIGGVKDNEQTLIFNEDIESIIIYLTASLYDTTINLELLFSDLVVVNQNSDTSYEPYQTPQEYEINLGKNLVDFSNLQTTSNTNFTWVNDVLTITSTSGTYNRAQIDITDLIKNNPNKVLRFGYESIDFSQSANAGVILQIVNNGTTSYTGIVSSNGTITNYTIPDDTSGITQVILRIMTNNTSTSQATQTIFTKPMIEFSEISTSYSSYFTPIHLYEDDQIIGTPNNWSIVSNKKEIIFDENTNILRSNTNENFTSFYYANSTIKLSSQVISNYFTYESQYGNILSAIKTGITTHPTVNRIYICLPTSIASTSEELKTWLSTHNTKVAYELAEPTTEPITNTELIEDLNNFYNKAKSYNGQTNISVDGDLQMILDVSAIIGD